MSFLTRSSRLLFTALARPALARGYASEAPASGKMAVTFCVPHQTIYKGSDVTQVNLSASTGDMGILSHHVPVVEQLNPGVVEVISGSGSKKWFISGGFATMNADSTLSINAVEAFALEDFSSENVHANMDAAKRLESSAPTELERAAAKVEVEVLEALSAAIKG